MFVLGGGGYRILVVGDDGMCWIEDMSKYRSCKEKKKVVGDVLGSC